MGREFELKYRCSDADFEALKAAFEGFRTIQMETTYYDTFDAKLNFHHWTLRRRFENGVSVCTVKTPDPKGGRSEWEAEAKGIMTGIPKLCQAGAPLELMMMTVGGVQEVCGAKFTRLALTLDIPGGKVELKEGSDSAAIAFAKLLEEKYHLVPESRSKYKRALSLARGV